MEKDTKRVNFAKENSKRYGVSSGIEFVNSDFFTMKNISVDLVFLHPTFEKDKYDLF